MSEIKNFYNRFHKNENHLLNRLMEDLRYKYLQEEVRRFEGKILVVGCGSKREMTLVSEKNSDVWGIDISEVAIEKSKENFPKYNFKVMDACNMDFANNSFDVIVCSEVIEHLSDHNKFLEKVSKILKNNGVFVLTTPNWCSMYGLMRWLAEILFKKPFTSDNQPIDNWSNPNTLINQLKIKGFEIHKIRGLWYLPPFGKGKYRLPAIITYPFYLLFIPFEKLFSIILPKFGHMIAITSTINKQ